MPSVLVTMEISINSSGSHVQQYVKQLYSLANLSKASLNMILITLSMWFSSPKLWPSPGDFIEMYLKTASL